MKIIFFLICCSLSCVVGEQTWNAFKNAQNEEKLKVRAAKFNSLFWSSRNVSNATMKKEIVSQSAAIQGRELKPIHQQLQPITTTALTKISRTDESLERSVERKKHHSGN